MIILEQVFEHLFSIPLGIYLGVALLGHIAILFKFLTDQQTIFYQQCTFLFLHNMVQPVFPFFSNYTHPSGCKVVGKSFFFFPFDKHLLDVSYVLGTETRARFSSGVFNRHQKGI